jgi:hypothetical protein
MRYLLLLLFPAILSARVYVVDAGDVEINSQTYQSAKLTYTFDAPLVLENFSVAKAESLNTKAIKLRVDYKENGENKTKNFLGKMPKVKKVKLSKVDEKPIKPEEKPSKPEKEKA